MEKCKISSDVRKSIYSTVAAVLHLGNIKFAAVEDSRGGCAVDKAAQGELEVGVCRDKPNQTDCFRFQIILSSVLASADIKMVVS